MIVLRIISIIVPLVLIIVGSVLLLLPTFYLDQPEIPEELKGQEKVILVDLENQTLYGYQNDALMYAMLVCTGRRGKETPVGTHKVGWKAEDYTSREYNAPMPYSMFFVVNRGIAIHGTRALFWRWRGIKFGGDFGSGGCVGLTRDDARTLFEWAPKKTIVHVVDSLDPNFQKPAKPTEVHVGAESKT